jgi:hypothetical protein
MEGGANKDPFVRRAELPDQRPGFQIPDLSRFQ